MTTPTVLPALPRPERVPDNYYLDILRAIRDRLPGGLAVASYFEVGTPPPPRDGFGRPVRLSSKRLLLRHPQSGYERAEDRHGRPYTKVTGRREADALLAVLRWQASRGR